jgi:hypothetical protein
MSKKEESRFNIRFNPADPAHQIAIEILSHAGRSKANLIANALVFYLKGAGDESAAYVPDSLALGKMPKIKSEKKRGKKPPKPQATVIFDSTPEHEYVTPAETTETSQFPTLPFEGDNGSEDNSEPKIPPDVQGAVFNMLDMFRG